MYTWCCLTCHYFQRLLLFLIIIIYSGGGALGWSGIESLCRGNGIVDWHLAEVYKIRIPRTARVVAAFKHKSFKRAVSTRRSLNCPPKCRAMRRWDNARYSVVVRVSCIVCVVMRSGHRGQGVLTLHAHRHPLQHITVRFTVSSSIWAYDINSAPLNLQNRRAKNRTIIGRLSYGWSRDFFSGVCLEILVQTIDFKTT